MHGFMGVQFQSENLLVKSKKAENRVEICFAALRIRGSYGIIGAEE